MVDWKQMWNDRYSEAEYVYGREPNEFLASLKDRLPKQGRVLCLAEGEGRNAVWLAKQGLDVVAMDLSAVGLAKADRLAADEGVEIETICADIRDFEVKPESWDVIVSIFMPMEPELRREVYSKVMTGLATGGMFIMEMYTPRQLQMGTGGPPSADLMVDESIIRQELIDLKYEILIEKDRRIVEGQGHTGDSAVVQLLGIKA